jgi:hypothetical protein
MRERVDLVMNKIKLIGLALVAVLAFGAFSAASASAEKVTGGEPAFWLVKGEDPGTGVELAADIEGELELSHLGSAAVLCSGLFEGVIYNGAERGEGLITKVWSLGTTQEEVALGGKVLLCKPLSVCEPTMEAEVVPEQLPWLLTLTLMTLDSEEKAAELFLVLLSADPELPAYDIICLVFTILIEELCFGETSAFLELVGTTLIGKYTIMDQELEGLEGTCGSSANVAALAGEGEVKLSSGEELMVSSTRGAGE